MATAWTVKRSEAGISINSAIPLFNMFQTLRYRYGVEAASAYCKSRDAGVRAQDAFDNMLAVAGDED